MRESPSKDPVFLPDQEPRNWKEAIQKVKSEMPNASTGNILLEAIRRYGYLRKGLDTERNNFPVGVVKGQPKKFDNRLKELREQAGITQMKLSVNSGVSITRIQQIENYPAISPTIPTAWHLAVALDCTVAELFPAIDPTK